ncbi:hypothetical protein, partial [Acinetobacter sp. CFCC 10889]|uniref:hypothetical protein n=1 Tax=Acinetobacter sp. CFCC 10889 TaxID=1775557 RepID=UPI001BC87129
KLKIYEKKKFQGFRDEVPNVLRFLNEIETSKRAIKFLMEVQAKFSRTNFNKIADIGRNYFVIVL